MSEEETTEEATETPDAWRNEWAGEDEAKLEHIGRYASVHAALDGGYSANLKVASGDYKKAEDFPSGGSEEDQAKWRASNGRPEAADKYGFEVNDDNKSLIDSLSATAFANQMTDKDAKVMHDWVNTHAQEREDALNELDNADIETTEDALRTEWGTEYRTNLNKINGLMEIAPGDINTQLLNARLEDGTQIKSNPDAMKFLIDLALIKNPTTTLVPAGGDLMSSIEDEIKTIKSKMGTKEYNDDEKMQARYRELITARDSQK